MFAYHATDFLYISTFHSVIGPLVISQILLIIMGFFMFSSLQQKLHASIVIVFRFASPVDWEEAADT